MLRSFTGIPSNREVGYALFKFLCIQEIQTTSTDTKNPMALKTTWDNVLAEKGGFEPPKPVLRACTLSRGVPSASRPLLRTT